MRDAMKPLQSTLVLVTLSTLTCARPAAAHFQLKKPTSWLKEDAAGGPQKGSPCGPGGYDNVTPTPTSGAVTEFHAGDTIEVDWVDTIAHPGYFRIALAQNRDDLKNPTIVQDATCNFDESMVPKTASGNVLADGVHFRTRNGFSAPAGTMFSQMVTLPNTPCDKCTLQVMQIMENDIQSLSHCYYFHCADIKILPAGAPSNTGGATGSGDASTGGMGGLGMAGAPVMVMGNGGAIGTSSGGTTGLGGMLGMVGTPMTGPTGAGAVGTPGTQTTPPPAMTGSGGTTTAAPTGTPQGGAAGVTAVGGAAGATMNEGDSNSSCSVALRSRPAKTATALAPIALLALFGFARRRSPRSTRRK
jgi:hypothetical protein